uniref:DM1 locus, WD repeat containing n=1 Tax=Oryctolagus cuniculus TaxID=9986 RepID=A0A5F9CS88_RABIT
MPKIAASGAEGGATCGPVWAPPRPWRHPSHATPSQPCLRLRPQRRGGDRVCFNLGCELYFYPGCCCRRSQRSMDLKKPIDKWIYKGMQPTCHDFNQFAAATETISLLVGFPAGQVQYLNLKGDTSKLFNEEWLIDKTKVTNLKWLPKSESLFLASHSSGHLYLCHVGHPCASALAPYSLLRQGEGFAAYTTDSKAPHNPLAKWAVGEWPLNKFAFSPDSRHLAWVSQDGCQRVFYFDSMILRRLMKSYLDGVLCVCWSPDGCYMVTGGEDDLVTVWSFTEGRVVARGHGHKSWVNAVAFNPYTTWVVMGRGAVRRRGRPRLGAQALPDASRSSRCPRPASLPTASARPARTRRSASGTSPKICCTHTHPLAHTRTLPGTMLAVACSLWASEPGLGPWPGSLSCSNSLPHLESSGKAGAQARWRQSPARSAALATSPCSRCSLGNISHGGGGGGRDKASGPALCSRLDPAKVLGTALCPRIHEVPLLDMLLFLGDCIITACQEGLVCTWAQHILSWNKEQLTRACFSSLVGI